MALPRIFVSHSSEDRDFTVSLVEDLRTAGADVWYDEHDLGIGQLLDQIMGEIASREVFIVVLSSAALSSPWVRDECKWAYSLYLRGRDRLILPVAIEHLDSKLLDSLLFMDSFRRLESDKSLSQGDAIDDLITRVHRALGLERQILGPPVGLLKIDDVSMLLACAAAYTRQYEPWNALPLYLRVTELAPDCAEAWVGVGRNYREQMKYPESVAAYRRSLSLDASNAETWYELGFSLRNAGDYAAAYDAFSRAVEFKPGDARYWCSKGIAINDLSLYHYDPSQSRRRIAEALEALERSVALGTDDHVTWRTIGHLHLLAGHVHEAIRACETAVSRSPTSDGNWTLLAEALVEDGRWNEALGAVKQALILSPHNPRAWSVQGKALLGAGRPTAAIAVFDRIIIEVPDQALGLEAWTDKGDALSALGLYEESLAAYRRTLRDWPTNSRAHLGIDRCIDALGAGKDEGDMDDDAVDDG